MIKQIGYEENTKKRNLIVQLQNRMQWKDSIIMEKNLTEKIFVNSQRNYFLKYFVFNILNEFSFPYSRIIAFICVNIEVH